MSTLHAYHAKLSSNAKAIEEKTRIFASLTITVETYTLSHSLHTTDANNRKEAKKQKRTKKQVLLQYLNSIE